MERYITDAIYNNTEQPGDKNVEIAMIRLYERLSDKLPREEYLYMEEELNRIHDMIEKEWFRRGVEEGVRLLLKSI
jgi:hypothetical protein